MSLNNQRCCKPISQTTQGIVACNSTGKFDDMKDINCTDNIIKVVGVCSEDELEGKLGADDLEWTEIQIPEVLCIPPKKPDIEEVLSVKLKVDIISQRVVKTPVFTPATGPDEPIENEEGIISTGRKLVIEGIIRQTIKYTAAKKEQSIHGAHFDIPFSVYIIVEEGTLLGQKYIIDPCIEDVFVCTLNPRQIFKNVTLFFKADKFEGCLP
jgi:spore morphogenesis protein SipL